MPMPADDRWDLEYDVVIAGYGYAGANVLQTFAPGNNAECFIGGRIAGRNAADEMPWND
jgi:hypothetical protein